MTTAGYGIEESLRVYGTRGPVSITATTAHESTAPTECVGCHGAKGAPIAGDVHITAAKPGAAIVTLTLCQECGRDLANVVGFLCIRDGGWSKLEPRMRRGARRPR